jgi:magnesium transporter
LLAAVAGVQILVTLDAQRVRALRERGEFFWLELTNPNRDELDRVVDLLEIPGFAAEDTREFGQRAKLDAYQRAALLVFYGATPPADGGTRLVETHLHILDQALVTVTREPLPALTEACRRLGQGSAAHEAQIQVVHTVLDALTDSLLAALAGLDEAIDELHEALAERPATATRPRIFALRRQLTGMRQVIVPQRDLLAPAGELFTVIPNLHSTRRARYAFRDVHDHLDRSATLVGSYREQIAGLLELYLSEGSFRMNEVMRQLAVIATVFLPLTFLVGFFGMNFGWMQQKITPAWTFFAFGIGLLILSGIGVTAYLRRSGADKQ